MNQPDLNKLRIERSPGDSRTRKGRRWGRLAIAVIVIAAVALWAANRFSAPQAVETVGVVNAWPSQNHTVLNASGYVVPQRNASLSSKGQGRLEWLGVLEGSRVKANEVIARLESRDVRASQDQAAAQVNVARANLELALAEERDARGNLRRSADLTAKGFISGSQHDTNIARAEKAVANVASARAAVASAEASKRVADVAVEQTQIRAPFDGIVLTKNANVGDNITPFSSALNSKGAVVTIADMSTLEVEADVSESSIVRIRVDQPCEIQLDALPDLRLPGVVSRIVPTVDRAKATVMVKVRFTERDARVLPDMSAKVAFLDKAVGADERKPVTAVQAGAITERGGSKVAFVVTDGIARQVAVTPGGKIGDLVQVGGLKAGDKVVLSPGPKLKDGMAVTAAKK
jgi:HlyD family secretion protein